MPINNIFLFESWDIENYYPFSVLHCLWEIRCGAFRLFEKIQHQFPEAIMNFRGRKPHLASFKTRFHYSEQSLQKGGTIIYNASIIPKSSVWSDILEIINNPSIEHPNKLLFSTDGFVFASYLSDIADFDPSAAYLTDFNSDFYQDATRFECSVFDKINYLWDALSHVGHGIRDDYILLKATMKPIEHQKHDGIHLINKSQILVGDNVKIMPTVVLDAESGPIIIGNNVQIMSHATIIGPCFIGDNTIIKIGAKIYENNSFGEFCKVGGEVENSIIQSYSNKQHEGFLGHSYICEWVNLGADTNTSDLKNTYANIKLRLPDKEVDSGRQFVGLMCGDHTKSAINSSFTTGTVAGIFGILVSDNTFPNYIQSFAWGGKKDSLTYKVSKAVEVAEIVMARRNRSLTAEERVLISDEYEKVKK
ncbi:MAG: putative sugar nucleotidyl transferase [Candidatus Kapabacteria bacterium]|nr:putative sugar nucleotidyl transferase [Candidatus Kapabacteria bacterium]